MDHVLNLSVQSILRCLQADMEEYLERDEDGLAIDAKELGKHEEADVAAIFRVAQGIVAKIRLSNLLWEALQHQCQARRITVKRPILDVRTQ
jgi:phosphosulfolactate synthase (CoM biosynthesis protein A)